MSDTAAYLLFPNDAPKSAATPTAASVPTAAVPVAGTTGNPASSAGSAVADKPNNPANVLFANETKPSEIDSAVERIGSLANAVRLGGDADRADALVETSNILVAEAHANSMTSADLREIIGYVHEASGTLSPMTSDQLADGMAKGMAELADVPAADLDLARGLIRQMSEKIPSLPYQLEATGLGNRPDFIRAVIREARRRSAGR